MYSAPYIFHFLHPLVKTAEMMVQRVNFEQIHQKDVSTDGISIVLLSEKVVSKTSDT